MPDAFNPWETLDAELEASVSDGGGMFCGVSQEQFAINGVTYKWPRGSRLKWGVGFSRLGQLSGQDCKDAITEFLKEISDCCDVSFEYVANVNAANIRYTAQRLDGSNGVLADMQIPVGNVSADSTSLLGRFDDGENWVLAQNPPNGTIDFYRVGLHETEHAMGLGHKPASIQQPALIAPVYSPVWRNLQPADKAELMRRYGPPQATAPATPVPPLGDSLGLEILITAASGQKYKATGNAKRQ